MGILSKRGFFASSSPNTSPQPFGEDETGAKPAIAHTERAISPRRIGWQLPRGGDGDTAMTLFAASEGNTEIGDPEEEKKLERKIDFMILPYLAVCYAFFYIDKTTLSYAAIFDIQEDLNLHGTQYNWLSSIFYFGFLFFALPTNFLLQRLPIGIAVNVAPRLSADYEIGKYLGFNIFMWGFFLMLQAACDNFATLAVLRFLAGAAEACSDPSFMLITQMWYKRRQQPVRIGIWYTANGLGIAGGGLLGYAIGNIQGSLPSWKYEFLIIGALCSAWGIVMFIMLPNSPVSAKLLTQRQRRMAVERLRENQTGVENKHLKVYQIREAFKDYKIYFFFLLGVVGNVPNGGISNFGTLIIKGFGFSTLVTTVMQARAFDNPVAKTDDNHRPTYPLGIWSMIFSHLAEVVLILTFWFLLSKENKRRDRVQSEMEGGLAGRDLDATAFSDLTDRENLNFRYIY
ncbi:MAG: hypothetical protein LQ342_001090 [Letrouitia transgressa]|nr:MAG: hypothetical protein LQ342_001090 [Letrouitia transgressa]